MTLTTTDFHYIREIVFERSAIVLEPGKEYLVESRLVPLAKREGYDSLDRLVAAMKNGRHGPLTGKVVEAMTTNETSFYRDMHPFEGLKKSIIPDLLQKRAATRTLSIWSAACSSGQEIYSIAMLLRENFPQLATWKLQMLATDLSPEMVRRASEGIFSQLEVNRGLPAPHLVKYFQKAGMQWQIKDDLRKQIDFKEMNLAEAWSRVPDMDIIFIRNVLIYFSVDTKRDILGKIRQVLRRDGYLFLGAAETTLNIDDSYERVQFDKAWCYRLRQA